MDMKDRGSTAGAVPFDSQSQQVPATRAHKFKSDQHARELFGSAYDAIPKSVFATMAYYLAGNIVDSAEDVGLVHARLLDEIDALTGQIIPERQGKSAAKAFLEFVNKVQP